jgi:hypothetical protein
MRKIQIAALGCSLFSGSVAAQSLDGWTIVSSDAVSTVYKDPATGSVAVVLATTSSTGINDADLRGNGKMLESLCPGLMSATVISTFGGRGKEIRQSTAQAECRVVGAAYNGKGTMAVSMSKAGNGPATDGALDGTIAARLGFKISRPVTPKAALAANTASNSVPAADRGGDNALKNYIASIPVSRRPVRVAIKWTSGFSGYPAMPTYSISVYLFFANGYATSCADWDPAQLAPTPQSLGAARTDCSLNRWRQVKGALEVQRDDGNWSGEGLADDVIGFKPGERINIAFGNVRSFGVSGTVSTGTMSGGDLAMRGDGQFAAGDWSVTNISGASVSGYASNSGRALVGRYYLDGNIIAVAGKDGRISAGFITGTRSNGQMDHVYLNGVHFWRGDE